MSAISILPTVFDLTIYRGDSVNIEFVIENYELSEGADWKSSVKSGATFIQEATVNASIAPGNQVLQFLLSPSETTDLVPGTNYSYDIQMSKTINSLPTRKTLIKGTINVVADITLEGDGV